MNTNDYQERQKAKKILDDAGIPSNTSWYLWITEEEPLRDQYKNSSNWVTCACGERAERIEREGENYLRINSAPIDATLRALGREFHTSVSDDARELSAKILVKIEKRVAELEAEFTLRELAR